jgi:hypothetical protein
MTIWPSMSQLVPPADPHPLGDDVALMIDTFAQ